jgi:pimeloyl-ACP methyl ester carboxylesterase
MITYDSTRESEQLRYLRTDIADFIQRYASKPANPGRRTLFLFAGGMASQLLRATTSYRDDGTPQTFQYDNYWLSPLTFLGGALFLGMQKQADGSFRDFDDQIVIPHGVVNFMGLAPYSRFTQWCELNNLDWYIFSWDWRRRLDDTVNFFFTQFLPLFRAEVQQQCGADPLQQFILMGHSFGGMVVKLMLHRNEAILNNMTQAVTVASPFYGYDGQIRRWFQGESLLNHVGPFDLTLEMIQVITSLPGCYVLPYLDHDTFVANKLALNGDADFPLAGYPSTDAVTGQPVDPFKPGPDRYPTDTGFDYDELTLALNTYRTIAAPLPAAHVNKLFSIRGGSARTPGSIKWGMLKGPLNPDAPPVSKGPGGPGDDTQPAWSTRLVTLGPNRIVAVGGNVHHMFMMDDDVTQAAIASVL